MQNPALKFELMSADDFEELILDMPADEKWELIGGRVIRGRIGEQWEHKRIVQNISIAMMNVFRSQGSPCRPFNETFWLKQKLLDLQVFPGVMVRCGLLEPGAAHLSDPVVIVEVLSPAGTKSGTAIKNSTASGIMFSSPGTRLISRFSAGAKPIGAAFRCLRGWTRF